MNHQINVEAWAEEVLTHLLEEMEEILLMENQLVLREELHLIMENDER